MHVLPRDVHPGDVIDYHGHQGTVTQTLRINDVPDWLLMLADNDDVIVPPGCSVEVIATRDRLADAEATVSRAFGPAPSAKYWDTKWSRT